MKSLGWFAVLGSLLGLMAVATVLAQSRQGSVGLDLCIAHYNLENLFDTLNDQRINDEDFLPQSELMWNSQRYYTKLRKLAKVIAGLNQGLAPDLVGLCEMENEEVLRDLLRQPELRRSSLGFLHCPSNDPRGIDVALLYRKSRFKPIARTDLTVDLPGDSALPTRRILLVSGKLPAGDTLHILVNHWPSRRGGVGKSAPKRYAAARTLRKAVDSLFARYGGADHCQIVIAGDFNDTPLDASIRLVLGADSIASLGLFHPMASLGGGSYCFQDRWEWLDQIILSRCLMPIPVPLASTASVFSNPPSKARQTGPKAKPRNHYLPGSARAVVDSGLLQEDGEFKGYPHRTYAGNRYLGGPSDHLPVVLQIRCPRCL
jgi:predicted extracellular nuclease